MQFLDLTLNTPQENLALDEALLIEAELHAGPGELMRIWESKTNFVVLGSSSRYHDEANVASCRRDGVPIVRRNSGGAAIVTGPGCLMYSVLLSYKRRPTLRSIDAAHRHVLGVLAESIEKRVAGVERAGISDLGILGRKFSGNSMRCKREHAVYHGTLLYDFPLPLVEKYLGSPQRQPEYRAGRSHGEFIMNLPLARDELIAATREAFKAAEAVVSWPHELTQQLATDKFARDEWTRRL